MKGDIEILSIAYRPSPICIHSEETGPTSCALLWQRQLAFAAVTHSLTMIVVVKHADYVMHGRRTTLSEVENRDRDIYMSKNGSARERER